MKLKFFAIISVVYSIFIHSCGQGQQKLVLQEQLQLAQELYNNDEILEALIIYKNITNSPEDYINKCFETPCYDYEEYIFNAYLEQIKILYYDLQNCTDAVETFIDSQKFYNDKSFNISYVLNEQGDMLYLIYWFLAEENDCQTFSDIKIKTHQWCEQILKTNNTSIASYNDFNIRQIYSAYSICDVASIESCDMLSDLYECQFNPINNCDNIEQKIIPIINENGTATTEELQKVSEIVDSIPDILKQCIEQIKITDQVDCERDGWHTVDELGYGIITLCKQRNYQNGAFEDEHLLEFVTFHEFGHHLATQIKPEILYAYNLCWQLELFTKPPEEYFADFIANYYTSTDLIENLVNNASEPLSDYYYYMLPWFENNIYRH